MAELITTEDNLSVKIKNDRTNFFFLIKIILLHVHVLDFFKNKDLRGKIVFLVSHIEQSFIDDSDERKSANFAWIFERF